jgi:hypothetical protein
MRFAALLVGCLALAPLALAPTRAVADDDEPAAPGAPAAGPATISSEWKKEIKKKNKAYARERGEHWAKTVKPTDKDIFWLGLIWDKAAEHEKAIAAFEAYLKIPDGKDTNKESCYVKIMENQAEMQQWDKAITAGQEGLKLYPGSRGAAGTWHVLGRIQRRKGDLDGAIASFREALNMKRSTALFDIVDIYMLQGDAAKAKAACVEFKEVFQKDALKANRDMLEAFVDRIGQPAPSLEGSTPLWEQGGAEEPPADPNADPMAPAPAPAAGAPSLAYGGGKPTLLYHVHHGAVMLEVRLQNLKNSKLADTARVWGIVTLKQVDATRQAEDKTLTPEKEQENIEKYLDARGQGVQALLVKPATFEALGMRWAGQMILIDKEGKLRWMRLNDENTDQYDWYAVTEAVKKLGS